MKKKYRLRPGQETIEIVDGPMAGRRYEKGKTYAEVPPQEAHRFEEMRPKKKAPAKKSAAQRPDDAAPGEQIGPADMPPAAEGGRA